MLLKAEQKEVLTDLLFVAISETSVYFNVGKNMTPQQINTTIDLILNDTVALNLSFEDYKVMFEFAKKGAYGVTFDRVDGQIIFSWIYQYSTDRTNEFLRIKDFNEKQALNVPLNKFDINIEGQKKVVEALKSAITSTGLIVKEKPVREKSTYEKLIQRFHLQFTKIVCGNNKRSLDDSYRFIFMYGREMNANEYVEFKLMQHDKVMKIVLIKKL